MNDPESQKEYEKADAEFALVESLVKARADAKMSQADVAKRIGTTQSAIARLEGGKVSPSISCYVDRPRLRGQNCKLI